MIKPGGWGWNVNRIDSCSVLSIVECLARDVDQEHCAHDSPDRRVHYLKQSVRKP